MADDGAIFESLYAKFGVEDRVYWDASCDAFFRWRVYDDGVWLDGEREEPVVYWGC